LKFVDLNAQFQAIESETRAAIDRVLEHGQFIMGPEVFELEDKLANFTGVKHAISCASGTDALLMALMAYDVGPGDAVFTTPFTFFATAEVIALLGVTPVFVDIDSDTFNIDPEKLEGVIEKFKQTSKLRPRGVIPVDLFGLTADYSRINEICNKHNLFVIEDAAQSFGATYNGKRAGNLADVGTTSFFPAKPLGAYGDGGALFTDNDALAKEYKSIRMHGQGVNQYDNVRLGITGRLDSIQAAVLICKLKIFEDELIRRNEIASQYQRLLSDVVKTPSVPENYSSAWALFSVLSERRDEIKQSLQEAGIPSVVYYPKPLHLQPAFSHLNQEQGSFPIAEKISGGILSLPIHPYLTNAEVEQICACVIDTMEEAA